MSVYVKERREQACATCSAMIKSDSGTLVFLLNLKKGKSAGVAHYKMEQSVYSWIYSTF
jgi:hypothetical protein